MMVFNEKTVKRIVFGITGNRFICIRMDPVFKLQISLGKTPVFSQDSTLEVGGFSHHFKHGGQCLLEDDRSLHPKKNGETHNS